MSNHDVEEDWTDDCDRNTPPASSIRLRRLRSLRQTNRLIRRRLRARSDPDRHVVEGARLHLDRLDLPSRCNSGRSHLEIESCRRSGGIGEGERGRRGKGESIQCRSVSASGWYVEGRGAYLKWREEEYALTRPSGIATKPPRTLVDEAQADSPVV
jgi:hypothetical protein